MQPTAQASTTSSQAYTPDDRNDKVQVYVNGDFVPRAEARISVFDAGYVCGDGVWEGVRLVKASGARKFVLFHHDPGQNDAAVAEKEKRARALFPNTVAAHEGLTLEV